MPGIYFLLYPATLCKFPPVSPVVADLSGRRQFFSQQTAGSVSSLRELMTDYRKTNAKVLRASKVACVLSPPEWCPGSVVVSSSRVGVYP